VRREVAHRMVFGTTLIDPGLRQRRRVLKRRRIWRAMPVDLPLRLDDAGASPTTPQVRKAHKHVIKEGEVRSRADER